MTLHFPDQHSADSLHYRNRAKITVHMCERKPYPVWFSLPAQRAKKVVSDSPGLVDFAIGLVNSVLNLPDGQVMFFEEFK